MPEILDSFSEPSPRALLSCYKNTTDPVFLGACSERDRRWEERRAYADGFRDLYRGTIFDRYAQRIDLCSDRLQFVFATDETTGDFKLKLQAARFCRVARCPVCQWRRSLMWRAKAVKVLPKILEEFPKARFIFLTLTVRSCDITELRDTLAWMNEGWTRLSRLRKFPGLGFIKATEVTRGVDDTAHPHFHCLIMVKSSYFSGDYYLSQEQWTEMWKKSLRIEYTPIVDVRAVKPRKESEVLEDRISMERVPSHLLEVFKYTVKASEFVKPKPWNEQVISDQEWLVKLTDQLHKSRLINTGGVFKKYLAELEQEPEDLIHADEVGETEVDGSSPRVIFDWKESAKRYRMKD